MKYEIIERGKSLKYIIAILIFGIIVFIHELGHFLFAKANGILVQEFSIGMGPTLFSFTRKDTKYSLKLLPLGGSCMMLGEDESSNDSRAFNNKSVWARFSVVFAGPLFNFILAFVLALVLTALVGGDKPVVMQVEENSPAAIAGLQEGDVIKEYNGAHIGVGREIFLADFIDPVGETPIEITYERDGKEETTTLTPELKKRYLFGMNYTANDEKLEVTVSEGGALANAGVKTGDIIVGIDGVTISSGKEFHEYTNAHDLTSEPREITYEHDGKEKTVTVTPTESEYYETGLACNCNYSDGNEKVGILGTMKYAALEIRYQIKSVILSLKYLCSGHFSADSVAGPVGIVNIVGDSYTQSKEAGFLSVFATMTSLCIMLSANLGVMNLLPIPALDGGRLLFMIVEMIRGKKMDPDKEGFVHFIGFVLLMILMVVVLFNDIRNIFMK